MAAPRKKPKRVKADGDTIVATIVAVIAHPRKVLGLAVAKSFFDLGVSKESTRAR